MSIVRLVLFAGAVALTPQGVLRAGEAVRISITVRVYQQAGLRYTLGERARAEADRVLRSARVDVLWKDCADVNAACELSPEPSELVLRVAAEGAPGESTCLGTALVVPPAGGKFATVYSRHVARVATHAQADVAVLLGRVAAHELGHLLMNTPAHAPLGLMRPTWTAREVRRNRAGDWAFTVADMAAMRQPGP